VPDGPLVGLEWVIHYHHSSYMSNTNTAATQPRYIQNTIQNTEATENNKNRNTATNNTQATEVQTEQEQIPNTTSTTSINNRHPMHLQKPWGHDHAVKTLGSIHILLQNISGIDLMSTSSIKHGAL